MTSLFLASQSASRRSLLSAAGVPFESCATAFDENAAKERVRAAGLDAKAVAMELARGKALGAEVDDANALILGCDQTLELSDGTQLDKAASPEEAADILRCLSGSTHHLHSAAVVIKSGEVVWSAIESVRLAVRPLSDAFIAQYLAAEWEEIRWCVGCYRIEGPGAQLFSRIEGNQFAIQGLPMLALLDFLREQGVLVA